MPRPEYDAPFGTDPGFREPDFTPRRAREEYEEDQWGNGIEELDRSTNDESDPENH